ATGAWRSQCRRCGDRWSEIRRRTHRALAERPNPTSQIDRGAAMNFETLRQYLEEAHGRPCVWEHQDAPEPERPFLSMAVLGIETIGKDWHGSADAGGIMEMIGQREATIGIYANPAHRADPNESQRVMLDIARGLNMPSTIWLLQLA